MRLWPWLFFSARHGLAPIPREVCRRLVGGSWGLVGAWVVVGWLLVENCIVDASIFVFCG